MTGPAPGLYAAQALTAIERFMNKHFASNFKDLNVALKVSELKAGKRPAANLVGADPMASGEAEVGGEEAVGDKSKRARIELGIIGRTHIDAYLSMYISLSGNPTARSALFASILQTAQLQTDVLNSQNWTVKVISERLHNALKAKNKADKAGGVAAA
tara:strand:+ start:897 stop:1370 length:474 start_codon:yes stop_codon:yes gene_type:complete